MSFPLKPGTGPVASPIIVASPSVAATPGPTASPSPSAAPAASQSPSAPPKLSIAVGFNPDKDEFVFDGDGPLEMPLTPRRAKRRETALSSQDLVLKSSDPNYFPPLPIERVKQLIEQFRKEFGVNFWLKGSWTDPNAKPRDLDFGACLFGAPVGCEKVIRAKLLSVLIERVKNIPKFGNTKWVPVESYFTETIIYDLRDRVTIIIYRGSGIDITFYIRPERFSLGYEGWWWSCGEEAVTRLSQGRRFVTQKELFARALELQKNHLNEIDGPYHTHNLHMRYALDIVRMGKFWDNTASVAAIKSFHRERSAEKFGRKLADFQQDHYEFDVSKILEILIYYTLHAYDESRCVTITNAWEIASKLQKIKGMVEFCAVVKEAPYLVPKILDVIRGIYLFEGAEAYTFLFNDPKHPIRPLLGTKVDEDTTHYLLLPNKNSSPVQMGQQFLKSRQFLLDFAEKNHPIPACRHLAFLRPFLNRLGLSTKYLSRSYNFEQLHEFYGSKRAGELQALFGPYPQASSFLQKLPPLSRPALPALAPAQVSALPPSVVALWGPPAAAVPAPVGAQVTREKYEVKGEPSALQPSVQRLFDLASSLAPPAAVPVPVPRPESASQSATLPAVPKPEQPESFGNDLLGCRKLAEKHQLLVVKDITVDIEALLKLGASGQDDSKAIHEKLHGIIEKFKVVSIEEIEAKLGPNYFKEFLRDHLVMILQKALSSSSQELLSLAMHFYSQIWSWECLSDEVEKEAVHLLIKAWLGMKIDRGSDLYSRGVTLISNALSKYFSSDRATNLSLYEVMASSPNPTYLKLAYEAVHQFIGNFEQNKDVKIVDMIISLLTTTLMNRIEEMYYPLFNVIVELSELNSPHFDNAISRVKGIFLPGLMNIIITSIEKLKFDGDEIVLFKTLACLQKYHTPATIKLAVQAFDALIREQRRVDSHRKMTQPQLVIVGALATSLIGQSKTLDSPIEWKDAFMRERWLSIAMILREIKEEQIEAFLYSGTNMFQNYAIKLLEHFNTAWVEPEWQEKVAALMPRKVTVIVKAESSDKPVSEVPKAEGSNHVQQLARAVDLLLRVLTSSSEKHAKARDNRIMENAASLLEVLRRPELPTKHTQDLQTEMTKVQYYLSKVQHPHAGVVLHEILTAATAKNLLELADNRYISWVIKCNLKNRGAHFSLERMKKLILLTIDIYNKGLLDIPTGLLDDLTDSCIIKSNAPAPKTSFLNPTEFETIFEVFGVLYAEFPNAKLDINIPFSIWDLMKQYLELLKPELVRIEDEYTLDAERSVGIRNTEKTQEFSIDQQSHATIRNSPKIIITQPNCKQIFSLLGSIALNPDHTNFASLLRVLAQLVKVERLSLENQKSLIDLIKHVMVSASSNEKLVGEAFHHFAYALWHSSYNVSFSKMVQKNVRPTLPIKTRLEVIYCLCCGDSRQAVTDEEGIAEMQIQGLQLLKKEIEDDKALHKTLVKMVRTRLNRGAFAEQAVGKLLNCYIKAFPDLSQEMKSEIYVLMMQNAFLGNNHEAISLFITRFPREIHTKVIDSVAMAIKFLEYVKTKKLEKLTAIERGCFLGALKLCQASDTPDVDKALADVYELALNCYKSVESYCLSSDFIDGTNDAEFFEGVEYEFLAIGSYFPEKVRKAIPHLLHSLLQSNNNNSTLLLQLFNLFDKFGIYSRKIDPKPLRTVPLTEKEQAEVNQEKFYLQHEMILRRLATINYPEDNYFKDDDLFPLLSGIRQLASVDNEDMMNKLMVLHYQFSDTVLSKVPLVLSPGDLIKFNAEMYSYMTSLLQKAKQAKSLNQKAKVQSLVKACRTCYLMLSNNLKKLAVLPASFTILNALASEGSAPYKEKYIDIHEAAIFYKTNLYQALMSSIPRLRTDDALIYAELAMTGISMMMDPQHFENAISQKAKLFASGHCSVMLTELMTFAGSDLVQYFKNDLKLDFAQLEHNHIAWLLLFAPTDNTEDKGTPSGKEETRGLKGDPKVKQDKKSVSQSGSASAAQSASALAVAPQSAQGAGSASAKKKKKKAKKKKAAKPASASAV